MPVPWDKRWREVGHTLPVNESPMTKCKKRKYTGCLRLDIGGGLVDRGV